MIRCLSVNGGRTILSFSNNLFYFRPTSKNCLNLFIFILKTLQKKSKLPAKTNQVQPVYTEKCKKIVPLIRTVQLWKETSVQ